MTGSRSADPGNGFEDRMPVDCYLGARVSGPEPLQPDELSMLSQRFWRRNDDKLLMRYILHPLSENLP